MFGKNGPTFWELMRQALSSTRAGYDLIAPKFDLTPFRTPDSVLEPTIAVIGPVDAVLDVCCGTGAAMRLLRPLCRMRLVGLDFSEGMLAQARSRMELESHVALRGDGANAPRVEFVQADALAMPFAAEFDAAVCFGALGHILPLDQAAFARQIYQALRPGGRFVFVTATPPPPYSSASIILHLFNLIMKVRNALLKPPFIMYYLTSFLLPDVQTLLENEGFEVEVRAGLLPVPFQRYSVVIATRV